MQTAVAAPIDLSLPLAVSLSHPPLLDPRRRTERPPATAPWTAALAGLRIEYLRGAGTGLAQLRQSLDRLAADPADLEALAGTLRGFHSFAESGTTYGFPRVSEIGRAGEAACASLAAGRALPEAYRFAALGALLDSLEAWFAAAVAIAALGAPAAPGALAADPAAGSQAPAVTAFGLPPTGAPPPPAAAPVTARQARRSEGDPPSPHPDPAAPHPAVAGGRILVVDDDPAQAGSIRATLESAGHEVQVCDDPRRFAGDLAAFDPELVLMDLVLPGVTGYELVRSLRQAPGSPAPPVLYLAARGEMHARTESARAVGDDHLVKPLSPAALLAAVGGRLERHRRARQPVTSDPVTGAPNEAELLERARATVADRQRDPGRRACWVAVELDHLWSIHECYGETTGNRVLAAAAALLRSHLRPGDTLARCDDDRLAVLVEDLPPRQLTTLLDGLRQQFAGTPHRTPAGGHFRTTFSAGIAALAPGMTAEHWREAADRALRQARAAGRNRVELIRHG
jgi:diguanylate cyclase (GGDEF)-like protein